MSPREQSQDNLSRLIGHVASAGAQTEFALRRLTVALLDSQYAEVITAGKTVSQLINDCRVLVKVNISLTPQQKEEVTSHLNALGELLQTRNDLVHGLLTVSGTGPSEVEAITATHSKAHKPFYTRTITVADAQQTASTLDGKAKNILLWTFTTLPKQAQRQQILPPL